MMKKAMFLAVILGMLVCNTNAFAMVADPTYYSATAASIDTSFTATIPGLLNAYTFSWSLTPNPGKPFTDATLDLTGTGNTFGSPLLVSPNITGGGIYTLYTADSLSFTNGNASLPLNIAALNAYIAANHLNTLNFVLKTSATSASVTGATLTGNTAVAPEPISMALVGAGLICLPFARRLRKAVMKEA